LFYEALRLERQDDYYSRFDCRIPFLNGGLFDPINDYDWIDTDILLPNDLFSNGQKTKEGDTGTGILDVFDRYNFTVKEDEPLEKEVAIDPELLGKAYEKFNAIRPDNFEEYKKSLKSSKKGDETKFNKQYGVYYTPRVIVHYMSQQSLINYLYTELNSGPVSYEKLGDPQLNMLGNKGEKGQLDLTIEHKSTPSISKEDIEALIHVGEHVSENEEIALIKEKSIKDGKQVSSVYKLKLPESIRQNASLIDRKLEEITVCDPAVGSGAFPVGMMSEIERARNVLSIFLNDNSRTAYEFKRRCIEHSLYGVDIDPGAVEITKLRLWLSLVVDEDDIKNIKPLPNLDYKVVCGNSLMGVEKNLLNKHLFIKLEELKSLYFNETNIKKKQNYKNEIDKLIHDITNGHEQFDFEIYFSEVFHNKGGFDVVIANPPYVRVDDIDKKQRKEFKNIYHSAKGKYDLYYLFFEKAFNLINKTGCCVFISPNKFCAADSALELRKLIFRKTHSAEIISTSKIKIFEAAANYPVISILSKNNLAMPCFLVRQVKDLELLNRKEQSKHFTTSPKSFLNFPSNIIPININQISFDFVEKLYSNSFLLSDILSISEGLRIPSKYESEEKQDHEIVKQYQFSRYSQITPGTFISSSNLKKVISDNAQRSIKIFMEKIVIAEDALSISATIDLQHRIPQGGVYFAVSKNPHISLKYILALINSKLFSYVYEMLYSGMHMGGGYLRYRTKFLEALPLSAKAKNVDTVKQKELVVLVDKFLSISKDENYLDNPTKQAKVKELEKQIDQMVYKLYELTDEEIGIIENSEN
jgi:hypothetical protein